jgi:RHS repeat-associated protein
MKATWRIRLFCSAANNAASVTPPPCRGAVRPTTPKTYLPFYDGNGNVTGLTDAADGSVAATYDYDPFGNLTASSGPAANVNPFRFSTKYFDSETGLYNFGYRFYSPAQGRFITRDPSGEFNGGANLYAFVGNDPLNGIDPQGLAEIRYKGPFIRRDPANENVSQIYYIQSTWDTPSRDYRPHPWDWEIGTSSIGIGVTAVARLKPIMIDMQIISRPIYGLWGQKADPASITKSVHDKPDGEVAGIIDNTLMELRTQLAIAENTREYASFTRDAFLQTAFMSTVAGGMQLKSALDDANMGVGGVGEPTPEYVSRRQDHSGKANGYVKQANRSPSPLKYDIAAHPNDVDLRGQDIGFQKALEQAFENTTVPRSQFQVSKWAKTIYGKTIPVEWTGPGGAEVSIDEAHVDRNWTLDKKWASGPDAPHIGWQRPGNNRKVGIGARGHIIVDSVPAGRQGAF